MFRCYTVTRLRCYSTESASRTCVPRKHSCSTAAAPASSPPPSFAPSIPTTHPSSATSSSVSGHITKIACPSSLRSSARMPWSAAAEASASSEVSSLPHPDTICAPASQCQLVFTGGVGLSF
eukprot:1175793-Prorocentrum_minimum.AAC.9